MNGSPLKILEINRTFKSNEHLSLLPSPGKGKGSIELLCTLVPAAVSAIPASYIMSNVKP